MPSITLALAAGEASYSAGSGRTGRRLAYRPSPLRRPSRPCSGRGFAGSVVSHFGPPTAREQHGVGLLAGVEHLVGQRRAVRVDRGAAEEVLLELEVAELCRAARRVGAMISGPIPSPGSSDDGRWVSRSPSSVARDGARALAL